MQNTRTDIAEAMIVGMSEIACVLFWFVVFGTDMAIIKCHHDRPSRSRSLLATTLTTDWTRHRILLDTVDR